MRVRRLVEVGSVLCWDSDAIQILPFSGYGQGGIITCQLQSQFPHMKNGSNNPCTTYLEWISVNRNMEPVHESSCRLFYQHLAMGATWSCQSGGREHASVLSQRRQSSQHVESYLFLSLTNSDDSLSHSGSSPIKTSETTTYVIIILSPGCYCK